VRMANGDLELSVGSCVVLAGEPCRIKACLSLSSFLLTCVASGEEVVAKLGELAPVAGDDAGGPAEQGTVRLSEAAWQEARRREAVIRPLAAMALIPAAVADDAAATLGLSQRSIYALARGYRASGRLLTSLARRPPSGGRGKGRLPSSTERIIADTVTEMYLSKQRLGVAEVAEEAQRRCRLAGFRPPSVKAIRRRIQALRTSETTLKPPDAVRVACSCGDRQVEVDASIEVGVEATIRIDMGVNRRLPLASVGKVVGDRATEAGKPPDPGRRVTRCGLGQWRCCRCKAERHGDRRTKDALSWAGTSVHASLTSE